MEKEVFEKLQSKWTYGRQYKNFSKLENILKEFNAFNADDREDYIASGKFQQKIAILNNGLITLGYSGIDMTFNSDQDGYSIKTARRNRIDSLSQLNPFDYVGTILPKGTAPLPRNK